VGRQHTVRPKQMDAKYIFFAHFSCKVCHEVSFAWIVAEDITVAKHQAQVSCPCQYILQGATYGFDELQRYLHKVAGEG
jgi:hypothetical protein